MVLKVFANLIDSMILWIFLFLKVINEKKYGHVSYINEHTLQEYASGILSNDESYVNTRT